LFFGFINCPDVCPTTLAVLSQVTKQVADLPQLQRPAVVFMSVDPQRDTPDKVGAYAGFFSPDFVGVTGMPEEVDNFTRALGVPVARVALDRGGYTVDHSGAIFVIDPSSSLRALFSSPRDAAELAADYRRLVTR
jgi:protein SCO1/2